MFGDLASLVGMETSDTELGDGRIFPAVLEGQSIRSVGSSVGLHPQLHLPSGQEKGRGVRAVGALMCMVTSAAGSITPISMCAERCGWGSLPRVFHGSSADDCGFSPPY